MNRRRFIGALKILGIGGAIGCGGIGAYAFKRMGRAPNLDDKICGDDNEKCDMKFDEILRQNGRNFLTSSDDYYILSDDEKAQTRYEIGENDDILKLNPSSNLIAKDDNISKNIDMINSQNLHKNQSVKLNLSASDKLVANQQSNKNLDNQNQQSNTNNSTDFTHNLSQPAKQISTKISNQIRSYRILHSPNFKNGAFVSQQSNEILNKKQNILRTWWCYFTANTSRAIPKMVLPTIKECYLSAPENSVTWLGHSSYFIKFGGVKILIDPVFSDFAAPVWFANRAFAGTSIFGVDDFGDIDILAITHDHYDHLDYATIRAMQGHYKCLICGLGVGSYLEDWGVAAEKIYEFDWGQSARFDGLQVHFTPGQHFSGRGFMRNVTLWGGFVFENNLQRIYVSGDTGYGAIFSKIREKFGGFDLAMLECGQYNLAWQGLHSRPPLTDKIAREIGAKRVIAGHNSRFRLSAHAWNEPYFAMEKFSQDGVYELMYPKIGQICQIYGENKFEKWWKS